MRNKNVNTEEVLDFARQRRIDVVEKQQEEISRRDRHVFVNLTKTITEGEKRLISYITRSLPFNVAWMMDWNVL